MKKIVKILIIILASLLLIWILAGSPVEAAEEPWYITKANKVDNPVILAEEDYYEGVSIKSNPISDLTFLEVPFEQFLDGSTSQMQVITISEAMFYRNQILENEIVLYLYVPDNYIEMHGLELEYFNVDKITTYIEIFEQLGFDGTNYFNLLSKYDTTTFRYEWSKVSSHDHIIKFSYSKNTEYSIKNSNFKDVLLKEYNTFQNVTVVNSKFEIKINSISDGEVTFWQYNRENNNFIDTWITRQEMNFIYNKANKTTENGNEKVHTISNIVYDEGTVTVDGKLFRLRYTTDAAKDLMWTGGDSIYGHDYDYTDFFYYFFDVIDDTTNNKWDGKQVITGIDYTYYEYKMGFNLHKKLTHVDPIFGNSNYWELATEVRYYNSGGIPYDTDYSFYEGWVYEENDNGQENTFTFENIKLRDPSTLKDIYQRTVVKQDTYTFKYPTPGQTMVEWWGGQYDTTITTLPTLFSTTDTNFVASLDKELLKGVHSTDYQYAFMVGNQNGYAASSVYDYYGYPMLFLGKDTLTEIQHGVELIGVNWIYYDYLNVSHAVEVSETTVDKSNINNPVNPGGSSNQPPLFPEQPGPKEGEPNWWQKIGGFFGKIGNFFKQTKGLWIVLGIGLLVIIAFKLIRNFLDWMNTFRMSRTLRTQQRLQRQQMQQQKSNYKKKTSKKKKSKKRKK